MSAAGAGRLTGMRSRDGMIALTRREKADGGQVLLDNTTDSREQAWHIVPVHPLTAARIEHGLQFLDHEGDVSTSPEHGGNHPRKGYGPRIMLHVL